MDDLLILYFGNYVRHCKLQGINYIHRLASGETMAKEESMTLKAWEITNKTMNLDNTILNTVTAKHMVLDFS